MKKYLFVSSRTGGDWGQDLLFAGHVLAFGPNRVIDYPFHAKHREKLIYTGDPEKDWGLERRTFGWTPFNDRIPIFMRDEISFMLKTGIIDKIFIDERDDSYKLLMELQYQNSHVPIVVVAGHDSFQNESVEKVLSRFGSRLQMMFVDNARPEMLGPKVRAFSSFSTNLDHYWNRSTTPISKIWDISFQGYNSHPDRARFVDHILSRWGHLKLDIMLERRPDTFSSFVPRASYFQTMSQSRICLSLRGAAENGKSMRFYEIPYVGSCMLAQRTTDEATMKYEDGIDCAFFSDEIELDDKIEFLLANPQTRDRIADNGYIKLMRHDTAMQRVLWMHEVLNGRV